MLPFLSSKPMLPILLQKEYILLLRDYHQRPYKDVRRASNYVPRARKLTCSPALASSPPKYPPVPPAPMITIRICFLLHWIVVALFFRSSDQVRPMKSY
jgi:hypothetical protein